MPICSGPQQDSQQSLVQELTVVFCQDMALLQEFQLFAHLTDSLSVVSVSVDQVST